MGAPESRLNQIERMRVLVAQALAEARQQALPTLRVVHLVVYGNLPDSDIHHFFELVSTGTSASGAVLHIDRAGSRYICWNCCGTRFESSDGMCPNCGEIAMEVPEDIAFGLKRIEAG